ncbi:hypothetical protein [Streptomyces sp. SID3343]|uniref:hypothetical protein n=1 Tax=Streptomyces sp. SID3343 TaxID=2690260 RepID=UPI00136BFC01|nr:hypothetical protein [Streptomyces sp. SID3343]MYV96948.1 hypothetical protein [Streptomyces sp. SID3343]
MSVSCPCEWRSAKHFPDVPVTVAAREDDVAEAIEGDEHARYAYYIGAFERSEVDGAGEFELLAGVVGDPDPSMAEAVVIRHLDRRAEVLAAGAEFAAWSARVAPMIGHWEFASGRLREWTLLKSIVSAGPWAVGDLLAASNWLQLKVAKSVTDGRALGALAGAGRTRRIRYTGRVRSGEGAAGRSAGGVEDSAG